MKKERERTIKILEEEYKSYWNNILMDANSYNKGFNEGIQKAIKILKTENE